MVMRQRMTVHICGWESALGNPANAIGISTSSALPKFLHQIDTLNQAFDTGLRMRDALHGVPPSVSICIGS